MVCMTLLNSKGGVGKTTATIFLASALHEAGRSVEVWDADPQGSATGWGIDGELPFPVIAVNARSLAAKDSSADVLLIDTPPGDAATQNAAIRRSDLVIVPTAPAALDLQRVWTTLDGLAGHPAVVLLNQANPRTRTYTEARAALDAESVPYFDTTVKNLESYRRQANAPVSDLGAFQDIAAELIDMMKEND